MKSRLLAIFLMSLIAGFRTATSAQERFGTLTGRVTDQQGAAVPGVTVVATNVQTGEVRTFVADAEGRYVAADLNPGRYTVAFELTGFSRVERADINVLLGRTFELDSQLRVGAVTETVQVTGEAPPLVDTRGTIIAHNVTAEEFDRLPKGRSFQSIALAAPSVNQGEVEGGIQVNGASGAENAFTVDGVVTNSLINGQSRQNAVFEYLQEVQVKTTGIPAEFGGALGGVISAVTKSGGNTFRGEAHYYYEGSPLGMAESTNYSTKRLVLDPADDRTVLYVKDSKPTDHRNEIGGSIGGPIVRDKLFFYGSYSPRFHHLARDYMFSNGTEPGEIANDQTVTNAFGKISYSTNRLRADFAALFTPTRSEGTLPKYNGSAANVLSSSLEANRVNFDRGFESSQRNVTGRADVTLTHASFLSVRAGHFFDNYNDIGIPLITSWQYQTPSFGVVGIPPSLQGPSLTQNTPRAQITDHDTTRRNFFNIDYNAVVNAGGEHTLKGGVGWQRTVNDVLSFYPGGYVFIFWARDFVFQGNRGRGTHGYYEVNDRRITGEAGANIASLFIQDSWRVADRLTVNLGVRTENEKIPTFRPDIRENAMEFGFGDKIAPRLGAAYDVWGNGRLKAFGSWGRYYDWTKYELARGSFGAERWDIYYRGLDTFDLDSLSMTNKPGRDLWVVPGGFRDRRVPNFDTVDPELKPMSQDGTSLGVEHQLGNLNVLNVHYTHNDLRETIEDVGFLTAGGDEGYLIANPGRGSAQIQFPTGATPLGQPVPRPKRQYDALEIGISRRFANNYFWSANYVYSRLYGNYSGLASSDEISAPTTGVGSAVAQQQAGGISRPGGNANRAWDVDEMLYDSKGNLDQRGRLATDRPHVVKLYGAYTMPFGTQVGAFFYGASGTPVTTYVVSTHQTEIFVNGRGDMGRTPVLTRTNLLLAHELRMMRNRGLRLELNVLNLFNQRTAHYIFNYLNRGAGSPRPSSAIDLSHTDLTRGYDVNALIRATPDGAGAFDPRYGQEDLFEPGIQGQFMVKFMF